MKIEKSKGKSHHRKHYKSSGRIRISKRVETIWSREKEFIEGLYSLLPKKFDADENADDYLLDLSDSEETKKREKFLRKTKEILEATKINQEAEENQNGDTSKTNGNDQAGSEVSKPKTKIEKPSREELLKRLHAKMALVAQHKNSDKAKMRKEKKETKKNERRKDAKKQFTSKTNPNLKAKTSIPSSTIKNEVSSATELEKTPLRKSVKKSDGQVVYSKFDFIAGDKKQKEKPKPKVTELLKTAEKAESKIARLEARGKKSEAVQAAESQKWVTAIKRAQGDKVKDDPVLLKKTIKKQKKIKESSKKKWTERVENVEKQKELRTKKRLTNIQARKDDKKKKQKKVQRKKGRVI